MSRESKGTLSGLKATLSQYQIVKLSCPVSGVDVAAVFAHLKAKLGSQPGRSFPS